MFVHARSGAASYAACLRLFRTYPLAVSRCREDAQRSLVLRHHVAARSGAAGGAAAPAAAAGGGGYFSLSQDRAGHFVLRPWGNRDGEAHWIRPAEPVPAAVHEVITEGMPVPRDGALLGWVTDRLASALLTVVHGQPGGPQVRVLPMVGTEPLSWPPFATSPLSCGRLWEYVDRGHLVDLTAVIMRAPGCARWVPSQNRHRARASHGCAVVTRNLTAGDFWLPAGVYMDHWMLREGVPAPPASHLLALPGTVDLASRLG